MTNPFHYRSRESFPFHFMVPLWFFAVLLPLVFFLYIFEDIVRNEEETLRELNRQNLMTEMVGFQNDLQPRAFIINRMKSVDQAFGYDNRNDRVSMHDFKEVSQDRYNKLRNAIEFTLGGKIPGLFLHGPDCDEVLHLFDDCEFQARVSNLSPWTGVFRRFAEYSGNTRSARNARSAKNKNAFFPIIPSGKESKPEKSPTDDMEILRKTFGPYWNYWPGNKQCISFFSKVLPENPYYAVYSFAEELGRESTFRNFGGYFFVVSEREIKPENLCSWALNNTRSKGLRREILWATKVDRTGFSLSADGLRYFDLVPQHSLAYFSHFNSGKGGFLPENMNASFTPGMVVFAPDRLFQSPFRWFLDLGKPPIFLFIIFSGMWVLKNFALGAKTARLRLPAERVFRGFFRDRVFSVHLGKKIGFGVSLALFLPFSGFILGWHSSELFRDQVRDEEMLDHLSQRLLLFDKGLESMETFLSSRQNSLKRRVENLLNKGLEAVKEEARLWQKESDNPGSFEYMPTWRFAQKLIGKGKKISSEDERALKKHMKFHFPRRRDPEDISDLLAFLNKRIGSGSGLPKTDFQKFKYTILNWHVGSLRNSKVGSFCSYQLYGYSSGKEFSLVPPVFLKRRKVGIGQDIRGIAIQKALLIDGLKNLSPSAFQREKTQLDIARSIFDQHMGPDWIKNALDHEGMFYRITSDSDWAKYSLQTVYDPERIASPMTFVLRYLSGQTSTEYLERLPRSSKLFSGTYDGFSQKFLLFDRHGIIGDGKLSTFNGLERSDTEEIRNKGEETLITKTSGRWNITGDGVKTLFTSNFFPRFPSIGVAEATKVSHNVQMPVSLVSLLIFYSILVVVLISFILSQELLSPIRAFATFAKAVGAGWYEAKLKMNRGDEFGKMGVALNSMVSGLAERKRLSRFVSREVEKAVSSPEAGKSEPGGEVAEVTVLFSHIWDFNHLAQIHPPEEIVELLNDYFTAMEECINSCDGTIDKYIGDAIMAVFRSTPGSASHSVRACDAALRMRKGVAVFNEHRCARGNFTIQTGIGIASGKVISGRIGAQKGRLDFTVIGNTVNLAARLESQSHYASNTHVLIAPASIGHGKGGMRVNFIKRVPIKGRSRTFPLFELSCLRQT